MSDDPDFEEDENATPGPAWLGPKASEHEVVTRSRAGRGLTLRAMLPNAITAAALASGLTGISLAIKGDWRMALFAIILAGILDAMDGRIARLLKAQSRFGAELDSLADSISFGVAPALVLFLWSLGELPRLGWLAALAFAICCALRLARFNAQIDVEDQPHKSAGFLTGVPAPMGAGLAFLPMYLWLATGDAVYREPLYVAPWTILIAILMVSNMATPSWKSLRPSNEFRIAAIAVAALTVAALLTETWWTLVLISGVYLALILWAFLRYQKVKQARRAEKAKAD
ncbi:CDP-diacylglycerol--serine O-phosphatidyltransferase [Aurantiacibacter sp. MUD11]|uniref:CDP-diacylglycerol--serine O-phosphatidyltransferase n=1 Tax=Aurantiacibacter sp. MUD11 TaxID=3003265 RepID=UPI003FA49F01